MNNYMSTNFTTYGQEMDKIQKSVCVAKSGEKKSMQQYIKAMQGEIAKALPSVITFRAVQDGIRQITAPLLMRRTEAGVSLLMWMT